jgi:hypothetical protein
MGWGKHPTTHAFFASLGEVDVADHVVRIGVCRERDVDHPEVFLFGRETHLTESAVTQPKADAVRAEVVVEEHLDLRREAHELVGDGDVFPVPATVYV